MFLLSPLEAVPQRIGNGLGVELPSGHSWGHIQRLACKALGTNKVFH